MRHYEVHVSDGSRWLIEARFKERDRDEAIAMAKSIGARGQDVKLVVDEFNPYTNQSTEHVIYSALRRSRPAPKAVAWLFEEAPAKAKPRSWPLRSFASFDEPGQSRVALKIGGALTGGVAAAAGVYALFAEIGGAAAVWVGVPLSLAAFVATCGGLIAALLSFDERDALAGGIAAPAAAPPPPPAEVPLLAPDDPEPLPRERPPAEAAPAETAAEPPPPEDAGAPPEPLPAGAEALRRFLGESLEQARAAAGWLPRLPERDQFACHLFFAGAVAAVARNHGWSEAERRRVLLLALGLLEPDPRSAAFADCVDLHLLPAAQAALHTAGRRAAQAAQERRPKAEFDLSQALQRWREPPSTPTAEPAAVLHAAAEGGAAAEAVLDRLLGASLADSPAQCQAVGRPGGRTVRIAPATAALPLAVALERQAAAYNLGAPEPLALRLGLALLEDHPREPWRDPALRALRAAGMAGPGEIALAGGLAALHADDGTPLRSAGVVVVDLDRPPEEVWVVPRREGAA
ncbi:MAG TPA: hypothetical protein VEH84_04130 [Alphaproteobacteria bacterium]|nr:hypothetical protein [Alphaproteobacteria bacterium]